MNIQKERIAVVSDSATATGFRLAGVEDTFIPKNQEEVEAVLSQLLSDSSYGIIIITEALLEGCDWRLKKKVEATAKPIVVPIPGASGPIEQEESLSAVIKRALGIDLSKKK